MHVPPNCGFISPMPEYSSALSCFPDYRTLIQVAIAALQDILRRQAIFRALGDCREISNSSPQVLYKNIGLSIHPQRKEQVSKDMLSWFPLFFPFKVRAVIYMRRCIFHWDISRNHYIFRAIQSFKSRFGGSQTTDRCGMNGTQSPSFYCPQLCEQVRNCY